jgi:hypothetical protein
MTGADFVATVRLSTRDNTTLALPGESCDRVPAASLAGLYASGKITAKVRDGKPSPVVDEIKAHKGRKAAPKEQ